MKLVRFTEIDNIREEDERKYKYARVVPAVRQRWSGLLDMAMVDTSINNLFGGSGAVVSSTSIHMSAYENVVGGKLKLKGKALDVKAGGVKKKKKNRQLSDQMTQTNGNEIAEGGSIVTITEEDTENGLEESSGGGGGGSSYVDNLTPAERRYMEQRQKIDMHKMAKTSNKSHRDRISDFNQYLANMSEHYDIPKVGPG
ncbi:hypothetical protein L2E82_50019 [Cichorium intybus]|nr:hypothetical protein L2E82_50019 [Cichorium intybus]